MKKIVVIGAGAAGLAAATRARRVDPQARITVLEATREYSRGTCSLPYYLSGELGSAELLKGISQEELSRRNIDLLLESRVEKIDPLRRQVFANRRSWDYDRLVVCLGSRSRPVPLVGQNFSHPRLWTLRSIADADRIRQSLRELKPRRVAIIGGGYLGLEMAEVLALSGCRATIFHRQATLMRLHPDTHETVVRTVLRHGVDLRLECEVSLVDPDCRSRTVEFQTKNGARESLGFDAVFLAPGVVPNTGILAEAGARLGSHGGVLVDARAETSLSGVYAAGDGVEVPSSWSGRSRYVPLATVAARWGRVCGENAAGGSLRGPSSLECISIRLFETEVASVGHPQDWETADSLTLDIGGDSPFARRRSGRATFLTDSRTQRLVGAQFVAPQASAWADLASLAIREEKTLADLGELDLSYTPPLSSLWHPFLLAGRQAEKARYSSLEQKR